MNRPQSTHRLKLGAVALAAAAACGLAQAAQLADLPLEELMRLDSPAGVPLVIGFDDEADDLTMITSRGVARTWRGGSIQPSSLPADVAIPQMLRDGALPAEPEPVRPAAAATKKK